MSYFNIFAYITIFIAFFHPNNAEIGVPLFGSVLPLSNFAILILVVINFFCFSNHRVSLLNFNSRLIAFTLILFVFVTEFLIKPIVFEVDIANGIKGIRVGVFWLSVLFLAVIELRVNIKKFWRVFLIAIGISYALSLIDALPYIEIPTVKSSNDDGYRLINSNASFGVIGIIYLLFRDRIRAIKSFYFDTVAFLSVFMLILTFNRTYFVVLCFCLLWYFFICERHEKFRIIKISLIPFFLIVSLYFLSQPIQGLIETRIFSIVNNANYISDPGSVGGRAVIYSSVIERIKEGYWIFGMPGSEPIFIWPSEIINEASKEMMRTDTSFVNILLRYGVVPLFLFFVFLYIVFFKGRDNILKLTILSFTIASLNVDSLFLQNSIFFIVLFSYYVRLFQNKYSH